MVLYRYVENNFKNKNIVLVGNGKIDSDYSELIDKKDIVIRFNHLDNYTQKMSGEKFTHWIINHHTSEGNHGIKRSNICKIVKEKNIPVITPFYTSWSKNIKKCINYYAEKGIKLIYPDVDIIKKINNSKEPRTGFYMIKYLVTLKLKFSIVGFTAKGRGKHHDFQNEYDFILNSQNLIEIIDNNS